MGEEGYTGHNIPKTYPLITSTIVAMIGAVNISISIMFTKYELQGVMRFLTRSYYHISSLCANQNGLIFIFQAEKRQQLWQNGQRNGLHSFERPDKQEDNRITV